MQIELGSQMQKKLLREPAHPRGKLYTLNPGTSVSVWNYSNGWADADSSVAGTTVSILVCYCTKSFSFWGETGTEMWTPLSVPEALR